MNGGARQHSTTGPAYFKGVFMQVQYGPIVESASGSIGNITASKNKGGQYFRVRSIPLNPQTERQQESRNTLTKYARMWADLTAQQRAGWKNLGKQYGEKDAFGNAREVSGISAFIRTNANNDLLRNLNSSMNFNDRLDAPANLSLPPEGFISAEIDSANAWINFTPSIEYTADEYWTLVYLSNVPARPGYAVPKGAMRAAGAMYSPVNGQHIPYNPAEFPAAGQIVYAEIFFQWLNNGARKMIHAGYFTVI
jgi:hypothetical protein